jgi:glycosyltransferase involved in cell wall biosynthesis
VREKPLRVLHVITGLGPGGAERELAALVRHSVHHVEVAALYNAGAVAKEIRASGVRVHEIGMRSNTDVSVLPRLVRMMRRGSYQVVHTHLYRASVYGRVAAWIARVPAVVTTEHSLGVTQIEGRTLTPGIRRLYLATDRLSTRTIAVSDVAAMRLRKLGVDGNKIHVIPNGIELERFRFSLTDRLATRRRLQISEAAFVLGTVGRLEGVKRHERLLASAASLLTGDDRIVIAGEGSERLRMERIAGELGIGERTLFLGSVADIPPVLSAMDLFASASSEETFGLAPVEALANGLCVVVTTCPALEGRDDPAVRWAQSDERSFRAALRSAWGCARGTEPAEVVREYSIEPVAHAVDNVYRRAYASVVRH